MTQTLCTDINPELHVTYEEAIELHLHSMPGGEIDGEDVKKKIGEARAKLMQVQYKSASDLWLVMTDFFLLHQQICANWELHGNGFGQQSRSITDEGYGSFDPETAVNGDNRERPSSIQLRGVIEFTTFIFGIWLTKWVYSPMS
jgi:hypothetical protein